MYQLSLMKSLICKCKSKCMYINHVNIHIPWRLFTPLNLNLYIFFQVSIKPLYFIFHINFSLRKFKFSFEIVSVNSRSLLYRYFGEKNKKCYSSSTSILHAYHVHTLKTLGEVLYIFPFQYQINVQGCRIEINYSFILEIPGNTFPIWSTLLTT